MGASALKNHFANIDLLRAFAAVSVVVYHCIEHGKWAGFPTGGPLVTFRIGWIGVDLFFVISGFVIAYSALALYGEDRGGFTRNYWSRRIARIVPLYVLTGVVWALTRRGQFAGYTFGDWIFQAATHLTFTHSFFEQSHGAIDGVNWTLGIEMQFYLVVALLIGWIQRTPGWRIWLYTILVSWAWRACMFRLGGEDAWMHVMQLPGTLDAFGAGIFLAKLVRGESPGFRASPALWIAGACAAGYVVMSWFWSHPDYWHEAAMVILWRTPLSIFLVAVLGAAIALPQSLGTKWLRPVAYLGEISYGIYLWHLFAVGIILLKHRAEGLPALVLVLAMTIGAAALSYRYFERPIMERARRRA